MDYDADHNSWKFKRVPPLDVRQDKACFHTVSLAHYTIQEFLFSDRVMKSRVSYFTMSQEICAREILETILPPMTKADHSSLYPHTYSTFEVYCYTIARICPRFWGSVLLWHDPFWLQYNNFFETHKYSWRNLGFYDFDSFLMRVGTFDYEATGDPIATKAQYLVALLEMSCFDMAKKLLESRLLEATLSVLVP
jgi:hypothetical protein